MRVSRGAHRQFDLQPGSERAAFLSAAASILERAVDDVEATAQLAEAYGVDDFEIYELVQIAEDVWHVQLAPESMSGAEFERLVARYPSLEAITTAAEQGPRRADA